MMMIIPKWKVVVDRANEAPLVLHISETHLSNVLRDLAKFDFGQHVLGITIGQAPEPAAPQVVRGAIP